MYALQRKGIEMKKAIKKLYSQLEGRGLKGRAVSIQHLPELQEEITSRNAQGLFDEEFYRERLSFFTFKPPDDLPTAQSIIVVAVPRPQTRVRFSWHGKTLALILPPTYLGHNQVIRQTGDLLGELLAPDGSRVVQARLPQKLLTTHSGLGEYGRNNICFIPGMGSFFQPTVFYSDLACEEEPWGEPRMMERCQSCKACIIKCPTEAIAADRFLLHAERCLVFHNERPPDHPFPAWIDPAIHNSLMGCMICQQFCPEDKPFLGWFEGDEEFTQEETSLLLDGATQEQLPTKTVKKLERLELLEDLDKIPRNLGVHFRVKE